MSDTSPGGCGVGGWAFEDIVSGRTRGLLASGARTVLAGASRLYALGISRRNARYDRGRGVRRLSVPVISIGNITVGGTGKTPMTIWLCEFLRREGYKPAVVSRGYKGSDDQPADELSLLQRRCPGVIAVANPDRYAGGMAAVREHGADVIVLDDGFQHRRLARDFDVALIDATCPFGYGHILPRGLLREPVTSLRRADAIVLTRWDQADDEAHEELRLRLRTIAPDKPVLRAVHRPAGLVSLAGELLPAEVRFLRPMLFAAIARPIAFERTAMATGLTPAAVRWWPDHHAYSAPDLAAVAEQAKRCGADVLVTTEKDAVKIAAMKAAWPCPVAALRIDIAFADDEDTIMARLVSEALESRRAGG